VNSAPVWSSDSRYIAYFEYHGEAGGTTQLIEPAAVAPGKVEVVTGGLTPAAWSPRDQTLCGLGGHGYFHGGFFAMPEGGAHAVELPGIRTDGSMQAFTMTSCTWARDGRVAVSYAPRSPDRHERAFVAFLSRDLQFESLWPTAGVPQAWTADGRAVVLVEQTSAQPARYSLLYADGQLVALDLQADALLAVIAGR
jgi:hypothetical protein